MKRSRNLILSLAAHALVLALLLVSRWEPPRQGTVSVLNIELGGPAGIDHPPRVDRKVRAKKAVRIKPPDVVTPKSPSLTRESDAPSQEPTAASESLPAAGSVGTGSASALGQYVSEVVRLINQSKSYPRLALMREEQGQVMVAIDVAADGTISNARVETPCPFESLNHGAIETIQGMGKLPPLPPPLQGGVHLHIPILYQIGRI